MDFNKKKSMSMPISIINENEDENERDFLEFSKKVFQDYTDITNLYYL